MKDEIKSLFEEEVLAGSKMLNHDQQQQQPSAEMDTYRRHIGFKSIIQDNHFGAGVGVGGSLMKNSVLNNKISTNYNSTSEEDEN